MTERDPNRPDEPLPEVYSDLLGEAAEVAAKAVDRLRGLSDQYPDGLPAPLLAQLHRAHADPAAERRGAVRLPGAPDTVPARLAPDADPPIECRLLDRSPGGFSLRVGSLLLPGAVIIVRLSGPGQEAWFPAQVRHCRPDGDAWVVGCAFGAERPAV